MANTPEELALELAQAVLDSQARTEDQLRQRAGTVLGAAAIVVPVAALAASKTHHPFLSVLFLALAAIAFMGCVGSCSGALLPVNIQTGVRGFPLLQSARDSDADLQNMQERAAEGLDAIYTANNTTLKGVADQIQWGIYALSAEIAFVTAALISTVIN